MDAWRTPGRVIERETLYAETDALTLTDSGVFRPLWEDLRRGGTPSKLGGKSYPVVLNNCAARLLTFGKFPYLSVLIRYLHGYSVPGSTFVCLFGMFIFSTEQRT